MATQVTYAPCTEYTPQVCREALLQALQPLGGLDWVSAGMRIGIKANLVSAMEPQKAATTHPVLLAELTKLLRERGASVVIGDSPGGLYQAALLERTYRLCGLQLAQEAGAELNSDFSQKEAAFPEGQVLRSFTYTGWLDSCDAVINFCKLKTHGMLGMTCAVKNFFGTIPGTMKPEYHFRFPDAMDFASMLVDLQQYWKPRLHLVDAVVAMEGNGPTAGTPRPMGLLLASDNPYALDEVCAGLMGLGEDRVLTQKAARMRGLIPAAISVPAELTQFAAADFVLPPVRSTLFRSLLPGKAGELLGKAVEQALAPRPVLRGSCIGCGKCAAVCPAKAIAMKRKRPVIDRSRCIRCFCCQEFCPAGALQAVRPPVARLLTGKKNP